MSFFEWGGSGLFVVRLRTLAWAMGTALVTLLSAFFLPLLPPALSSPVSHVSTANKLVALTFDDGPDPRYTPRILTALAMNGAHATFFLLGSAVQEYPQLARRIVQEGNEVANHGYRHLNCRNCAREVARHDLERAQAIIQQATGVRPVLYRYPYGKYNQACLQAVEGMGLIPIQWTVDSVDWSRPPPGVIAAQVLSQVKPGSIVLMHDGGGSSRENTVAALDQILHTLRKEGYRMVTVSQMLRAGPAN